MSRVIALLVAFILLALPACAQESAPEESRPPTPKIKVVVDLKGDEYSVSVKPWRQVLGAAGNANGDPSKLVWEMKLKTDSQPEENWDMEIDLGRSSQHPFGDRQPGRFKAKPGTGAAETEQEIPGTAPDNEVWNYTIIIPLPGGREIILDPEYTKRP